MSQQSLNVPTAGPVSPTAFAGDINNSLDAIISKNSGASAPTNFPTTGGAPTQFQEWADLSVASSPAVKEYDGSNFVIKYIIDTVNHIFKPKMGGGNVSIASGATVDLGSVPDFLITITGNTDITSFGNNAKLQIGECKLLRFLGCLRVTYNSVTMILPAADNIDVQVGEILKMQYLGSGNWICVNRVPGSKWHVPPGTYLDIHASGAIPGTVRANGQTIGKIGSGATELADPSAQNCFVALYLQDVNLSVSGGRTGATRTTAINDFNAGKLLTLPDAKFRIRICQATHGAALDAARSGGALFSTGDQNTLGAVGGEAAHVVQGKESVPHTHTATISPSGSYWNNTVAFQAYQSGTSSISLQSPSITVASAYGVAVSLTNATPTVVTWASHGFVTGQPIAFDTSGGGLTAGTVYYVVNDIGAGSFHIASTEANARAGTRLASSAAFNANAWSAPNDMPPFIVIGTYIAL